MRPLVYLTPVGNLWLILEERKSDVIASGVHIKALDLETGEVIVFHRPLSELVIYGWREL